MYTYIMWTHSFLPFLLFRLLPSLYWAGASCLPELSSPSWFLLWFLLSFFDYYCPLMAILSYAVFEAGMLPQILLPEETNFLNGECLPHTQKCERYPQCCTHIGQASVCIISRLPSFNCPAGEKYLLLLSVICQEREPRGSRGWPICLLDAQSHWSPELSWQLMSMGEVLPICTFPSELSFLVLANILFFDLQLLWCFFHSQVAKSLTGVP